MSLLPQKSFSHIFLFLIISLTSLPFVSRSETPETGADASLALSNLSVPEETGKVQERFVGKPASRMVIQIQDVHANTTAQQNIAAILERLRVVFGVKTAALEGAWVSTSLPKSHAIPTSREKQLLAGTLLEDDRISGPVYAAIMSPEAITLVGVEDKASYEKNRSLFLAHLEKAKEIDGKLAAYGNSLRASQSSTWGPELLAFGNAFGKFRETSDLGKFLPLLLNASDTLGVDSSDLTQVLLLRDITALEKSFTKERLEKEVGQVIKKYKNRPWTLEELIRGGKIPPGEIGLYPEIKKLTLLYQLRDKVSLRDLTDQIGILTGRVLERLAKTPEERALWEKTERFYLAKKVLLLQATPEDIKAYDNTRAFLETELAGAGLAESLALSLDFYSTVKNRDEIFFRKIMSDPALTGDIAVVTGGFHTDGLSQKFRDSGISYITIMPELGGTSMNEKLYETRMKEDRETGNGKRVTQPFNVPRSTSPASADGQTLSERQNDIATIDKNFPPAFEILKQTKDVRRASARFAGDFVVVSRADRVADATARGAFRRSLGPDLVSVSTFRESAFMAMPRLEQLETVRQWLARADHAEQKVMLVSSVSALKGILADTRSEARVKEIVARGDILALAQDVPVTDMPELLLSTRGIDRFESPDIASLLGAPRFERLAKKRPFVIMRNGYQNGTYVVLPEHPSSLVLYRIVTLDDRLYQSARNPEFLALLQSLVGDILSQELPKRSV